MRGPSIGVDLGGTKIEIAVLAEDRSTLLRERLPTPAGDYDGTINTIASLAARARAVAGDDAPIGVGTPGSASKATGLMINANSTVLIGKPLRRDLEAVLGRRIRMANDANCFALSEATDGAGSGARTVFGVILGTGVGGGLAVGGRVLDGPNGIAGEWGHNPLPWPRPDELPGPQCYCGKRGCIETFLSGPALARTKSEIGDQAAFELYEDRLARALATTINVLDPDVVVLGGGVSNVDRLYQRVPVLLGRYVFTDTVRTPLIRARHGDSSGVRGAALLWAQDDWNG
jgi:fructokinase